MTHECDFATGYLCTSLNGVHVVRVNSYSTYLLIRYEHLISSKKKIPQKISHLFLSLAGTATSITSSFFFAAKVLLRQTGVCRDKMRLLLQQKYGCRDKMFFATKYFCHDKYLSQQKFCHNKHTGAWKGSKDCCVTTRVCLLWQNFCHDKGFVMTNIILLWQKFCCNKHIFVTTKDVFCHDKHMFIVTNMCLSRQKFCHDKSYTCGSSCQWYISSLNFIVAVIFPPTLKLWIISSLNFIVAVIFPPTLKLWIISSLNFIVAVIFPPTLKLWIISSLNFIVAVIFPPTLKLWIISSLNFIVAVIFPPTLKLWITYSWVEFCLCKTSFLSWKYTKCMNI